MRHIRGRISAHPEIPPGDTALVVSWVDLVDVTHGDRVLLVDPGHRRALAPLLARTAHVVAVSPHDLDDARLGTPIPSDPDTGHDLLCLDGVRLTDARLARLVERLSPRGRVVQVVDNRLSPLRLADAARGRPRGPAPRAHLSLPLRSLRRTGLEVSQVFGLLRSSASPVTAFDVLSGEGVETTIRATLSHVGGVRGALLRRLTRLRPSTLAWLTPAWLVVAERPPSGAATTVVDHHPGRIVGKISNRDSDEFKVVRGDPAHTLEKHYAVSTPRAEVEALTELEEVGFTLAPRVIGLPEERVCRFSWLRGEPLVLDRLDDEALVLWTMRAARLLARLQQLTRHPDGTVLVHGDYWLGNLLVADDRITGVVDWTQARRGSPEVDRRFLLASVLDHRPDDEPLRRRLEQIRDDALPGSSQPDPTACWLGDDAWPVTSDGAVPLADFADDVDVDKLLAWAEDQPTVPVLLPASWSALLLVCRHHDRLRPLLRFLLPDPQVVEHLAASGSARRGAPYPVAGYHAYVDPGAEVVGDFATEPAAPADPAASGRAGRVLRVTDRADVLSLGRAEVARLGLTGAVTVHLGRGDDGGLVVQSVEPFLGPGHRAGASRGVDVAGLCYADLAGLPRPRVDLQPDPEPTPPGRRRRR